MKLPLFVAAMRSNRCWSFSSHLGRPIGQRTCRTRHPNGPSTMGEVWFWLMKNLHFSYSSIPHWKIPVDFLHDLPTVLTHVSIFICVSIYHLSIHPSIRPSIHPSIHPPTWECIPLSKRVLPCHTSPVKKRGYPNWKIWDYIGLVGGIPTPLKNIYKKRRSVGVTIPNIWNNHPNVPNHQPVS